MRCDATIAEPASSRTRFAALACWPGCGRSRCSSSWNTASVPSSASTLSAADDVGRPQQGGGVERRQHEHPEHPVGAVDEGQALLGLQRDRPEAGRTQRGGRRPALAGDEHLALAQRRQGHVGERRQVAAAAERAVLGHDRREAVVQQPDELLDHDRAHARPAHGQRAGAQQHHGPHDLDLDGRADAGGVRADERQLQVGPPLGRDRHGGQGPEPGGDPVHGTTRPGQRVHATPALGHRRPRLGGQLDAVAASGDGLHLGRGEPRAPQQHRHLPLPRRSGRP